MELGGCQVGHNCPQIWGQGAAGGPKGGPYLEEGVTGG